MKPTKFMVMLAATLIFTLCVSPVWAQQPTPLPGGSSSQFLDALREIEKAAVAGQTNQTGAFFVLSGGFILVILVLVWKRREPEDKVTPTLAGIISQLSEHSEKEAEQRREDNSQFIKGIGAIVELAQSINQSTNSLAQRYANTDANVNTISTTLADMAANGSKPLQEVLKLVKLMDPRITLMSDTQLVNVASVLEQLANDSGEWRKEFAQELTKIITLLEKRRTDTQPVAVPPNGTTPN